MNAYDKHKAKFTAGQISAARNVAVSKAKEAKEAKESAIRDRHLVELAERTARIEREKAERDAERSACWARSQAQWERRQVAMAAKEINDERKRDNAEAYFNRDPVKWVAETYAQRVGFRTSKKHINIEQLIRDQYGLPRVTWSIKLISGEEKFEDLPPENRRGARVALKHMIQSPEVIALRAAIDGKPQDLFKGGACPWMGMGMGSAVSDED